ncbi:unnamed protein product [Brassica oleracea var. botrytis]
MDQHISLIILRIILVMTRSSSMIMGINDHEDHCHNYKDSEIWCK